MPQHRLASASTMRNTASERLLSWQTHPRIAAAASPAAAHTSAARGKRAISSQDQQARASRPWNRRRVSVVGVMRNQAASDALSEQHFAEQSTSSRIRKACHIPCHDGASCSRGAAGRQSKLFTRVSSSCRVAIRPQFSAERASGQHQPNQVKGETLTCRCPGQFIETKSRWSGFTT